MLMLKNEFLWKYSFTFFKFITGKKFNSWFYLNECCLNKVFVKVKFEYTHYYVVWFTYIFVPNVCASRFKTQILNSIISTFP